MLNYPNAVRNKDSHIYIFCVPQARRFEVDAYINKCQSYTPSPVRTPLLEKTFYNVTL